MRDTLICLAIMASLTAAAHAAPVRITSSEKHDMGPVWHPTTNTIAYIQEDSAGLWQIGAVQPDGSNVRTLATGPGSGYYGLSFSLNWVGATNMLLTNERYSYHEYLAMDTTAAPFARTASNGSDAAFASVLVVPGGCGGDMIRASRQDAAGSGSPMVLWRHRTSTPYQVTLRVAPFDDLIGQSTNSVGTIVLSGPDATGIRGAALTPNGSQFLVSLPNGALGGWDIFLGNSSGIGGLVQLTTTGETDGLLNFSPDVSPNGGEVLFSRGVNGVAGSFDIFMMSINGTGLDQLTDTAGIDEGSPVWSPDGTKCAYNRLDIGLGAEPDNWNIYVDTVPEPGTLALLAMGGLLALIRRRR